MRPRTCYPARAMSDWPLLFISAVSAEHRSLRATAAAQIQAFEDTWERNSESQAAHEELSLRGDKLGSVMRAFMEFLGPNDMMAYLAMMAPRLVELRRALKPTGSINFI